MAGKGGGSSCGVSGSDSNILTRSQEDEAKSSGASLKKSKAGPKVVKSRYLDYDKNLSGKGPLVNAFSGSFSKPAEKGRTPTQRSALPQKARPSACMQASALDYTPFGKDDLQSTLLEGHRIALPDLDLSAINLKPRTLKRSCPKPLIYSKVNKSPGQKRKGRPLPPLPDQDLLEMIESQTLLFTCLCSKVTVNLLQIKNKTDTERHVRNDIETPLNIRKIQKKVTKCFKSKNVRKGIEKKVEVLQPLTAKTEKFNAEYNHFATALDTTRHELPVKSIHIEGDRQGYLAEVQSLLTDAGKLLSELVLMPSSEVSQTSNLLKDLKGLALKTDTEVKRGCTEALQLSAAVSQEASLRHQQLSEEVHESQTLANWYFS
uniref:HAUS augmin like complex subunit 8 n=1 Tax=Latimeria chalumnae TaxID=7897 RepID=H3ANK6_LATCH